MRLSSDAVQELANKAEKEGGEKQTVYDIVEWITEIENEKRSDIYFQVAFIFLFSRLARKHGVDKLQSVLRDLQEAIPQLKTAETMIKNPQRH